jgi:hydrogenase maturation protease
MPRTLIAGFGNELRGDDGFGLAVIRRLRERGRLGPGVEVLEVGMAGLGLAQALLDPCDRLIIVDAVARGQAPGTVYTLAVEDVETGGEVDLHQAVPARVLALAKALGRLPREVWIVGCEPAEVEELTTALSPPVRAAVDAVVARVESLLAADRAPGSAEPPVSLDLAARDEVLQVMFWLTGEGLGPDVTAADVTRFVGDEPGVTAVLKRLVADGYAAPGTTAGAFRLTPLGQAEGRRRFLDEFEPYLARRGHGECGSADCDCVRGGECRSR